MGPNGEPLSGDGSMGGKTPKNRTGGGKRRRNGRWSPNETTSLINLVRQYGKGKWKKILEEGGPVFNNRSQVQLDSESWRLLQVPLCHPVMLKCRLITKQTCLCE